MSDSDYDAARTPRSRSSRSRSRSRSTSPSPPPVLRRSSRVRARASAARHHPVIDVADSPPASPPPARLEQLAYVTPAEIGIPDSDPVARLRVLVHPAAAALMTLHAHLMKTEVIGMLGGVVWGGAVVVAEAFSVREVADTELSNTGRNAYMEVELEPENSVEVLARIESKGLQVVGWYHSHPDKLFTVEPSRVDIENQANYQTFLFKDRPFVAAILAPYNKDLPGCAPAIEFWQTWQRDLPLRLPHTVDALSAVPRPVLPDYWRAESRPFPLAALADEAMLLVDAYKASAKRVRLATRWRGTMSCADKLRKALLAIVEHDAPEHPHHQHDLYRACVHRVMDHAVSAFDLASRQEQEERAERTRLALAQRAKRVRKR